MLLGFYPLLHYAVALIRLCLLFLHVMPRLHDDALLAGPLPMPLFYPVIVLVLLFDLGAMDNWAVATPRQG
jgi:hypothetical protein